MASMKVRLKKATKGTILQIAQDGWFTNGHFAIHRGELITQGLELPELEHDEVFLKAMGIDTQQSPNLDVTKAEPKGKGKPYTVSTFFTQYGDVLSRLMVADDEVALVQERYIQLLNDPVTLEGSDNRSPMGKANFFVMPVAPGEQELRELTQSLTRYRAKQEQKEERKQKEKAERARERVSQ